MAAPNSLPPPQPPDPSVIPPVQKNEKEDKAMEAANPFAGATASASGKVIEQAKAISSASGQQVDIKSLLEKCITQIEGPEPIKKLFSSIFTQDLRFLNLWQGLAEPDRKNVLKRAQALQSSNQKPDMIEKSIKYKIGQLSNWRASVGNSCDKELIDFRATLSKKHGQAAALQISDAIMNCVGWAKVKDKKALFNACIGSLASLNSAKADKKSVSDAVAGLSILGRILLTAASPEAGEMIFLAWKEMMGMYYRLAPPITSGLDAVDVYLKDMWGPVAKILDVFGKLFIAEPQLMPRFLLLLKTVPGFGDLLLDLRGKIGSQAFEQLIDTCAASILAPGFLTAITAPENLKTIKGILELDNSRNLHYWFSFFLKYPTELQGPFAAFLIENPAIAERINPNTLEYHFPEICQCFIEDKNRVIQIFNLAAEFSNILNDLIGTKEGDEDEYDDSAAIVAAFKGLLELQKDSKTLPLVHSLLLLWDRTSDASEVNDLLDILKVNPDLGRRIIEISSSGDSYLTFHLWNMFKSGAKDHLTLRLLQQANEVTAPIVMAILRLKKLNHPIVDLIAAKKPDTTFTSLERGLLALHAQGKEDLITEVLRIFKPHKVQSLEEKAYEDTFIGWIKAGRFGLAEGYLNRAKNGSEATWQMIFKAQILDHNLQQILYNFDRSMWVHTQNKQALDPSKVTAAQGSPTVVNHLLLTGQLLSVEAINKELELKLGTAKNPTEFVVAVAESLLTVGGAIDNNRIDAVLSSQALNRLPSFEKKHLMRVLNTIRNDHTFSDRMQILQAPPKPGRPEALIKSFLKVEGRQVTARDAQVSVLSALLTPLRQSSAGSCFGTAIAIQLESYDEGLKQTLEDYLSLVINGSISRGIPKIPYPISFEAERFNTVFQGDHFLSRAREFTYSTMAGKYELKHRFAKASCACIEGEIGRHLKQLTSKETTTLQAIEKRKTLQDRIFWGIEQFVVTRYLGHAKAADESIKGLGAWVLVNPDDESVLLDKAENIQKPFLKLFEKIIADFKGTPEETAFMQDLFGKILPAYIMDDVFLEELFHKDIKEIKATLHFNPQAIQNETLLADFAGHSAADLIATSHNLNVERFFPLNFGQAGHPLERLFNHVQNLSQSERTEALRNPEYLQTIECPSHVMNIPLGVLVPFVMKEKTPANLIDKMQKARDELMKTDAQMMVPDPTNSQTKKPLAYVIIDQYLQLCPAESRPYIHHALALAFRTKASATIQELCRLIVQTSVAVCPDWDAKQDAIIRIEMALRKVEVLKNKFPQPILMADTNWKEAPRCCLEFDIENKGTKTFIYNNNMELFEVRADWPVDNWEYYRFARSTDDFSRTYCQWPSGSAPIPFSLGSGVTL